MSLDNSQSGEPAENNNADDKLSKLPFKTLTIHPSDQLRIRILRLAKKLGISAAKVAERLVATAAEVKIPWLIVQPQNGPDAGVAFAQVEKVMVKVFNLFNQMAGAFYRVNADRDAKQLEGMRDGALELWVAAQRLAKETFFDPEEFRIMCESYDIVVENLQQLRKQIDEERKKEKPDAAKIAANANRIRRYETIQHVLKRLGCGGPRDAI